MDRQLRTIKKIAREQRLAREKLVGKPRAKTFDTAPNARKDRRTWKNQVRDET